MSDTLRIRNWDKWQTYRKDRGLPPWIKVHREVLRNPDWVMLTDAQRGQLVAMWVLAADRNGVIPASPGLVRKLCYMDAEPDLQLFMRHGFIEPDGDMAPERRQDDAPEESRGEESREEAERETDAHASGRAVDHPDDFSTPALADYLGEYAGCLHGVTEYTQRAIYGLVGPNGTEGNRWARLEDERRPPMLASIIESYQAAREGRAWHRSFFLSMVDSAVRDARKPPPTSEAAQHTSDSERRKIAGQRAAARRYNEEQQRQIQEGGAGVTSVSDIIDKLRAGGA